MVNGRWYRFSLNICSDLEQLFVYPFKLSHTCFEIKEKRRKEGGKPAGSTKGEVSGGKPAGSTKGEGSRGKQGSTKGEGSGKRGSTNGKRGSTKGEGSGKRGSTKGEGSVAEAKLVGLMDVLGLIRIRVRRGINLAVRDTLSSDPYCVISCSNQKVKTKVVRGNCNPVWNEELTIYIKDFDSPIVLSVFDKDTFTVDDSMGSAQIDIDPLIKCLKLGLQSLPEGTNVERVLPTKENCLAEESFIVWTKGGKMIQDMILKLNDVESGQVQLQIEWIEIPGCKGLRV